MPPDNRLARCRDRLTSVPSKRQCGPDNIADRRSIRFGIGGSQDRVAQRRVTSRIGCGRRREVVAGENDGRGNLMPGARYCRADAASSGNSGRADGRQRRIGAGDHRGQGLTRQRTARGRRRKSRRRGVGSADHREGREAVGASRSPCHVRCSIQPFIRRQKRPGAGRIGNRDRRDRRVGRPCGVDRIGGYWRGGKRSSRVVDDDVLADVGRGERASGDRDRGRARDRRDRAVLPLRVAQAAEVVGG